MTELFKDRRLLIFTARAVAFHFADAAMLPLVGKKLTHGMERGTAVLAWGFDAGFLALEGGALAGLALFALGTAESRATPIVEPADGLAPRPA